MKKNIHFSLLGLLYTIGIFSFYADGTKIKIGILNPRFFLTIDSNKTIMDLKKEVLKKFEKDRELFKLFSEDRGLEDQKKIKDCNIKDGDILDFYENSVFRSCSKKGENNSLIGDKKRAIDLEKDKNNNESENALNENLENKNEWPSSLKWKWIIFKIAVILGIAVNFSYYNTRGTK